MIRKLLTRCRTTSAPTPLDVHQQRDERLRGSTEWDRLITAVGDPLTTPTHPTTERRIKARGRVLAAPLGQADDLIAEVDLLAGPIATGTLVGRQEVAR